MRLVALCAVKDLPADGRLCAFEVEGQQICVANDGGRYAAIDNVCPHRGGPLAEGTLEDGHVLCPWHAWAFSLSDGKVAHDPTHAVKMFPLDVPKTGDDDVRVALDA